MAFLSVAGFPRRRERGIARGMRELLVLHAFVYLLRSEDLLVVSKSNAHAFANRVRIFTLKRQDVGPT